jgi:hypothetical protein
VKAGSILLSVHVRRSRTFTYRILGELTNSSAVLFKVCPTHRDKAEIKCMGSVGGKTSIEPKVYSSLTFGELSKIILMLMCFAQTLTWVIGLMNNCRCSI